MDIVLIADYLIEDFTRGAQLTDQGMLNYLGLDDIEQIRSRDVTYIDKDNFYILSSFFQLSEEHKQTLQGRKNYLIFEHDHGYVASRNPFMVPVGPPPGELVNGIGGGYRVEPTGIVDKDKLINVGLYKNAQAIICLTKWHAIQLAKNVPYNIEYLNGACWLPEALDNIDRIREATKKKHDYGFFNDDPILRLPNGQMFNQGNNIKNKTASLQYCIDNNLKYKLIPRITDNNKFLSVLSSFRHFIFFPLIPESCSRILTEAKMLGVDVITNDNSGAYFEDWFKLSGQELTDHYRNEIIPGTIETFRKYLP